jgi:hypothetical protein
MRQSIVLLIFVCCYLHSMGQQTGLLVSDSRYEQVPLLPTYSGVKYSEIPPRVSLKKYCPVPGNQGRSGSCVGWAIGYGALTIQRAVNNNLTDQARITSEANSAAFLYNQVRKTQSDCMEGVYLEDGLTTVKATGDCLETTFNFEKNDCAVKPDATHMAEAARYKVQDFAAVFALNEEPKSKISKTCKVLATKTPLVVGLGVTQSFYGILPGTETWNPDPSEAVVSHHAMVVVGYNSVEKYFELLNSFGPSWGQNGFVRLPFDDFERLCKYAYVLVVAPDQPAAPTVAQSTPVALPQDAMLTGEFVFRRPAGYVSNQEGEDLMFFEEVATKSANEVANGLYTTIAPKFAVGDVFQLVARDIPKGRYVYVFSQSSDGTLNVHFPRKEVAMATAGFVIEKTAEIVIPSEESLLQLPVPGKDYLCILYSQMPIPQFDERIKSIKKGNVPFLTQVQKSFEDVLIAPNQVQFSSEKMAFSATPQTDRGKIAAMIVLVVEAE